MLYCPAMVHYRQRTLLALGSNALQAAAEHADAVSQQRAVGGVVNVAFDDRRVHA
jgi:hypothetical protein